MSKVFEYITTHPLQALLVLLIGVSLSYTVIRLLKGFFGLFTRKRKARKEEEREQRQAELVLEKLGGIEAFSEIVALKVTSKQKIHIDKIKQELQTLQAMDKCPMELKAYIETVLKANPTLLLQYEEHKAKLVGKQSIKGKIPPKEKLEVAAEISTNATVVEKREQQPKEDITYV